MTSAPTWLCPEQVFDGARLRSGMAVRLSDGKVDMLSPVGEVPEGAARRDLPGILTPGFLDLQVNGGGGVLFNQTPTPEGIAQIAAAHRQFGTTGVLPTVITDLPEVLAQAVDAALNARDVQGCLGIHIEGPHLSVPRRGTHRTAFIRPMEQSTIDHVIRLRKADVPVMITVAPESTSIDQVRALAETGAVVSIGHSDADEAAVNALLGAGACCFTHLFNAMSPMLNRTPGVTGAAIASDAYCGMICDGIHVSDTMLGIAVRARPVADRMFLVSDAMPTVGGPDHFRLYDMDIRLEGGQLVNTEGSLAGAHVTMAESVARVVSHVGVSVEEALRMAVTVPTELMGLANTTLAGLPLDDLVLLGEDLTLRGLGAEVAQEHAAA